MTERSLPRIVLMALASCALGGCAVAGAPSFALFGAFFPAWMLCGLIAIMVAAAAGAVLRGPTFSEVVIPYQLALCTAVGLIVGLLVWTILFT
jgi:hypothetical protein